MTHKVKATREGLIGKPTASGYDIDRHVKFVALPSRQALGKFIRVKNVANGKCAIAQVLDIGPWYTADDSYVMGGNRPLAEKTVHTNGAGIDLGEAVWNALGMSDNGPVEWEFIEESIG